MAYTLYMTGQVHLLVCIYIYTHTHVYILDCSIYVCMYVMMYVYWIVCSIITYVELGPVCTDASSRGHSSKQIHMTYQPNR